MDFLKALSTLILPLMSDYYDSVREECCKGVDYLITNFIPARTDLTQQ